jgi:hypothetical protein
MGVCKPAAAAGPLEGARAPPGFRVMEVLEPITGRGPGPEAQGPGHCRALQPPCHTRNAACPHTQRNAAARKPAASRKQSSPFPFPRPHPRPGPRTRRRCHCLQQQREQLQQRRVRGGRVAQRDEPQQQAILQQLGLPAAAGRSQGKRELGFERTSWHGSAGPSRRVKGKARPCAARIAAAAAARVGRRRARTGWRRRRGSAAAAAPAAGRPRASRRPAR